MAEPWKDLYSRCKACETALVTVSTDTGEVVTLEANGQAYTLVIHERTVRVARSRALPVHRCPGKPEKEGAH